MMKHNQKLELFLDKVCAEVRATSMHSEIRDELRGHFEDLIAERQQLGASGEEAQQYAIMQMGDPHDIGRELHKIHKPRIPWGLLTAVMMLSAVSLLGMGSVEAGGLLEKYHLALLLRQTVFIVLGISLMTGMYFFNFKRLQSVSVHIYAAALLLIAVSLLFGLDLINGNRRYVSFMGLSFDLIGYSPYLFVVALAGIWTSSVALKWSGRIRGILELTLMLLPAGIYTAIRSFPELCVYLTVSLVLYVWIFRRWLSGVIVAAVSFAAGAAYMWNDTLLRERMIGAFNFNWRPYSTGYMNRMIYETITSAGWRGHGFGAAGEHLPYPYSDLFPVYLIQCFGWIGGLLFLAAVYWFCLKMISYAHAVSDTYGRMLIIAVGLMLSVRLVYGLSILSSRMLIISVPLPFLSYGQHVFIEFAAVGLLMGVYRRKDMLPAAQAAP